MNPTQPNTPEPRKDGEFDRRLEKLSKPSEMSVTKDSEQSINLPAQKIVTVISALNANQVAAAKEVRANHATIASELSAIGEQMATKEHVTAIFSSKRDAVEAVNARLARIDAMQAELGHRIFVAAVTLGTMILALGIAVAVVMGGHR